MPLSLDAAAKIVEVVDRDPTCRSRINSFLSSLPGDVGKGEVRNVMWAGWVKLIGYDLLGIDAAYQWICLGIAEAACSAITRARFEFVTTAIAVPNDKEDHWGAQVTIGQGGIYIFDWWATLDTRNPVICHVKDWKVDKGGVLFRKYNGFRIDPTSPTAGAKPKRGLAKLSGSKTYVVKPGDSLSAIAQREYGNASLWRKIYEANAGAIGSNPNLIKPHVKLVIPPTS
jgi:hypothetical protein